VVNISVMTPGFAAEEVGRGDREVLAQGPAASWCCGWEVAATD
jgi:hypothetical protein